LTQPRTQLILSRHGQTVWHRENRYAGVSDVDLTEHGRQQARALAAWSGRHRPDAFYCSPVRRARETAAPVAEALGITPTVVDELREVSFGVAEGRTLAELAAESPDVVELFRRDPVGHPFPGAEPVPAAAARGAGALRTIAAEQPGSTVLVVAHNTLLRLALCELLGLPLARYRDALPRLDNGALTRISLAADGTGGAALLSYNVPLPPVATTAETSRPAESGTR
jgi:2,3-bisphosphoglycerate-dependent phosphoglycerate mutase